MLIHNKELGFGDDQVLVFWGWSEFTILGVIGAESLQGILKNPFDYVTCCWL
jgi:hypothetical protein